MGGSWQFFVLLFAASLHLYNCSWFKRRCDYELVGPLYVWNLGASSHSSIFRAATFARIYGAGGWSPDPQDKHPWLQIDLTRKAHIKTIATQGTFNTYNWVTRYIVLYGDHPSNWKPYFQQGSNWVRENLRLLPSDGEMQYNWSLPDIPAYIYAFIHHLFQAGMQSYYELDAFRDILWHSKAK